MCARARVRERENESESVCEREGGTAYCEHFVGMRLCLCACVCARVLHVQGGAASTGLVSAVSSSCLLLCTPTARAQPYWNFHPSFLWDVRCSSQLVYAFVVGLANVDGIAPPWHLHARARTQMVSFSLQVWLALAAELGAPHDSLAKARAAALAAQQAVANALGPGPGVGLGA